ncbi:MAG: FkbM family methyltransferase [Planctomycetota bacterium]
MKLREVFYALGIKPQPRTYGFEVQTQDLGQYGPIQYARWLHPRAYDHQVKPAEIDALRQFIEPGDLCVDVGAHCGDTAVPMAIATGTDGCVVAMEPNRYLFPVLEENARLNAERGRIDCVMAAATPEPGTYTFGYTDPGFCNGGADGKLTWWRRRAQFPLQVEGKNLDTLLRTQYADRLDRLRYIKTDTEGNDLELLRSLTGLLAEYRPHLRVEVYKFCSTEYREQLFHLLDGLGYQVRAMPSDRDFFGKPLTAAGVRAIEHGDIFCVPSEAATQAA